MDLPQAWLRIDIEGPSLAMYAGNGSGTAEPTAWVYVGGGPVGDVAVGFDRFGIALSQYDTAVSDTLTFDVAEINTRPM